VYGPWRAADIAEFALLYHDAVYDPNAPTGENEDKSAALAREAAEVLGIPVLVTSAIVAAIRGTDYVRLATNKSPPVYDALTLSVVRIVHGCDLAQVAVPWTVFQKDTEEVWKEYGTPTPAMECKRALFLHALSVANLFRSIPTDRSTFFEQFREMARINAEYTMVDALKKAQVWLTEGTNTTGNPKDPTWLVAGEEDGELLPQHGQACFLFLTDSRCSCGNCGKVRVGIFIDQTPTRDAHFVLGTRDARLGEVTHLMPIPLPPPPNRPTKG
jgi:predicted metal-dependent HD superfamily phosphohydrolase